MLLLVVLRWAPRCARLSGPQSREPLSEVSDRAARLGAGSSARAARHVCPGWTASSDVSTPRPRRWPTSSHGSESWSATSPPARSRLTALQLRLASSPPPRPQRPPRGHGRVERPEKPRVLTRCWRRPLPPAPRAPSLRTCGRSVRGGRLVAAGAAVSRSVSQVPRPRRALRGHAHRTGGRGGSGENAIRTASDRHPSARAAENSMSWRCPIGPACRMICFARVRRGVSSSSTGLVWHWQARWSRRRRLELSRAARRCYDLPARGRG